MPSYECTCESCGKAFRAVRGTKQAPPRFCSLACKGASQKGKGWGWGLPAQAGETRLYPNMPKHNRVTRTAQERVEHETGMPLPQAIHHLYIEREMSISAIANHFGTGHRTVKTWLIEHEVPQRTPAEDKLLEMRHWTPEEREAIMAGCRAATRGAKQSHDHRCKIAKTKQERAMLSGDESEIMAAFNASGLYPIPLYAVDKYNIDFAFPEVMVAVEYNGGNWHNTPKKRAADEVKYAHLAEHGWTLLAFPRLAKERSIDSGNARIELDELVRQVAGAVRHANHRQDQ